MSAQSQRVNISMIPLKWGTIISILLPGALALFALAGFIPRLNCLLENFKDIGTVLGIALVMAAALCGEVLGAITRLVWEPFCLIRFCKSPDALSYLKSQNLDLYERGVENNYKYVTFYANFAWAVALLIASRVHAGDKPCSALIWLLVLVLVVLLRASYVQWTYYVNYMNKVFCERRDNAGQRSATGDTGSVHKGSSEGQHEEHRET